MRPHHFLLCALALAACERTNDAYCDQSMPCKNGGVCDFTAHQCGSGIAPDLSGTPPDLAGDGGGTMHDLASNDLPVTCGACAPATPICYGTTCTACNQVPNPDAACAALDTTHAHCALTGPAAGTCVACLANADCASTPTTPVCDANSHTCRACTANSDCDSLVCDTVFDPVFGGGISRGMCVPTSAGSVVYVAAQMPCPGGVDGSKGAPMCKIGDALGKVTATKNIIHIAAGNYAEDVQTGNGTFIFVGDPGTSAKGGGNEALHVNGASSNVIVIGMTYSGTGGGHSNVWCDKGSLSMYQSVSNASGDWGVAGDNGCSSLTIDQCVIGPSNPSGGLKIGASGSATSFSITNTFIILNGGVGGASIGAGATVPTHVFINNTLADNTAGASAAGVTCLSGGEFTLTNNIFFNNTMGALPAEGNCTVAYSCTDDATAAGNNNNTLVSAATPPGFVGSGNYHLASATSQCAGKGMPPAPPHDFDGDPRPASGTARYDVGADEFN
jgi:hypothetical protein